MAAWGPSRGIQSFANTGPDPRSENVDDEWTQWQAQNGPNNDPRQRGQRDRYRAYLLWLQQQKAAQENGGGRAYQQQRGGAQMLEEQPVAMVSPMADAMDQRMAQAMPGRYAARYGMNRRLRPGDQVDVGENGPEQLTVGAGGQVQVDPNPADALAAQDAAEHTAAVQRGSQRRAGISRFEETTPLGMTQSQAGAESSDEFNEYLAGKKRPDEIQNPLARVAAYKDAQINPHRQRDAIKAGFQAEADARVPGAQRTLEMAPRVGETNFQFQMRLKDSGYSADEVNQAWETSRKPDTSPERDARLAEARTGAAGRRAGAEAERSKYLMERFGVSSLRELDAQRGKDKDEAIQQFGDDRPMDVGAVKNRREAMAESRRRFDVTAATQAGKYDQTQEAARMKDRDAYIKSRVNNPNNPVDPETAGKEFDSTRPSRAASAPEPAADADVRREHANLASGLVSIKTDPTGKPIGYESTLNLDAENWDDKYAVAEKRISDFEASKIPEDKKREIAIGLIQQISDQWKAPGFLGGSVGEIFTGKRRARHEQRLKLLNRLKKIAGIGGESKSTIAPDTTPTRGQPQRAGGYQRHGG